MRLGVEPPNQEASNAEDGEPACNEDETESLIREHVRCGTDQQAQVPHCSKQLEGLTGALDRDQGDDRNRTSIRLSEDSFCSAIHFLANSCTVLAA
jgi:hypothetical protein